MTADLLVEHLVGSLAASMVDRKGLMRADGTVGHLAALSVGMMERT